MAANNYFGFPPHGGSQYAATGAATYQPTQTGYAVAPTPAAAATYTTQRAAPAYETAYQAAATHTTPGTYAVPAGTTATATTYDYGYARTAQTAYDATKTYYQQPAAATATYSTTDYQAAAKPAYSATYTTQTTRPATQTAQKASVYSTSYPAQASNNYTSVYTTPVAQQPTVKKTFHPQQSASNTTAVSYGGQTTYNTQNTVAAVSNNFNQSYTTQTSVVTPVQPAKPKTAPSTTYSGYDAALYSAATMYVAQQAQPNTAVTTVQTAQQKTTTNSWQSFKKPGLGATGMIKNIRPKMQPKPQQLHYCDVCKISCAGPQTYREHLEGQKHKKKEASMKTGSTPSLPRVGNAQRCELCDVTCTGSDAYTAHIRGAKHQKVVKLHTKLGKPIPPCDPKTIGTKSGGSLGTVKTEAGSTADSSSTAESLKEERVEDVDMVPENDITPVGQEYIEEITNDEGKVITFNCKLCECRFNDPNAKEMHMKGRRHRLQFKKKVNPDLVVDVKVSMRQKKMQEEKMRRQAVREEFFRRREEERATFWTDRMMEVEERMYWEERRRYEEELEYYDWYRRHHHPRGIPPPGHPYGPPVGPPLMPPPPNANYYPPGPPQGMRRPDTSDDRHVLSRHATIYPKESELQAVQKIVSHTEKALKFVSDHLTEGGAPNVATNPTTTPATGTSTSKPVTTPAAKPGPTPANKPAAASQKRPPLIKKEPVSPQAKKEDIPKKEDGRDGTIFSFQKDKEEASVGRVLKGVMRVGVLAKGLLLSGDTSVSLVVLCAEKPTKTLLSKVATNLPVQLKAVSPEDTYKVVIKPEDAAIQVIGSADPPITVTVTLTSPVVREPLIANSPEAGGKFLF
uniref:DZF domain-containing protein n=1 Tax=Clastoptera arizonana TaxID=38151 RepID=A0A1B6DB99_9HEMI